MTSVLNAEWLFFHTFYGWLSQYLWELGWPELCHNFWTLLYWVELGCFYVFAQFWNVFINCSITITQIFKNFGSLFLYFEYACFKYHKQKNRSKKYFDFTSYTDFFSMQLWWVETNSKLKKNISSLLSYDEKLLFATKKLKKMIFHPSIL